MVCFEFKTEHIKIYTVLQIACHLDRYYSEIISLGHSIRLIVEQTYHPNGCQDRYQSSDDTRFVELYITCTANRVPPLQSKSVNGHRREHTRTKRWQNYDISICPIDDCLIIGDDFQKVLDQFTLI